MSCTLAGTRDRQSMCLLPVPFVMLVCFSSVPPSPPQGIRCGTPFSLAAARAPRSLVRVSACAVFARERTAWPVLDPVHACLPLPAFLSAC